MSLQRQEWMEELGDSLRGPRRAKQRLIAELDAHVDDAIASELANGYTHDQAEAAALARLGAANDVGRRWSADASARQWAARARIVALGLVIAALGAPVALAQRSEHKPRHVPAPARAHQITQRPGI
jgi:HAAS domain-containing protein